MLLGSIENFGIGKFGKFLIEKNMIFRENQDKKMLKHFFPNPSNRKLQNVPGRLKMHSRATTDFFILSLKSDFDNYLLIFRKFSDISKIFIEPSNIFRKIFFRFFFCFRKLRYNSFPTHYSTPKKSSGSPRTSILKNLKKT